MPDSLFAFMFKMLAAVADGMMANGDGWRLAILGALCTAMWAISLRLLMILARPQDVPSRS